MVIDTLQVFTRRHGVFTEKRKTTIYKNTRCLILSTVLTKIADMQQVVHGDYQEANIFFTREPETEQVEVSAIIDWDQACYGPRTWEIVRVLDYTCELEPAACALTLAGYRTRQVLSQEELDHMARLYGLLNGHNIWNYEELYLRENERVRRYFQKDFVPFTTKWERLQG
jgi:Ser/Thr protein kinase RdoA (MazF antagonist)